MKSRRRRRSISGGARSGNSTPISPRRRAGVSCSPIRAAQVFGRSLSGVVRRPSSSTRAAVMKSFLIAYGDSGIADCDLQRALRFPKPRSALDIQIVPQSAIRNPQSAMKLIRSTIDLESRVQVMGALNVTPDSFSDGGKYDDLE